MLYLTSRPRGVPSRPSPGVGAGGNTWVNMISLGQGVQRAITTSSHCTHKGSEHNKGPTGLTASGADSNELCPSLNENTD